MNISHRDPKVERLLKSELTQRCRNASSVRCEEDLEKRRERKGMEGRREDGRRVCGEGRRDKEKKRREEGEV